MSRFVRVVAVTAAATAAIAVTTATATGETIWPWPSPALTVDGSFSPITLPKERPAPIALKVSGRIYTGDGTVPPQTDRITLDLDRYMALRTRGIGICRRSELQDTTTRQAKRRCGKALVGSGETMALIDLEGQDPYDATGKLLIFNGAKRDGRPTVIFHVRAALPLPTTYVVGSTVVKSPQRGFGKRIVVEVPSIADGAGGLTDVAVKINKRPKTGKRYLLARCARERLIADVGVELRSGIELDVTLVRRCKVEDERASKRR